MLFNRAVFEGSGLAQFRQIYYPIHSVCCCWYSRQLVLAAITVSTDSTPSCCVASSTHCVAVEGSWADRLEMIQVGMSQHIPPSSVNLSSCSATRRRSLPALSRCHNRLFSLFCAERLELSFRGGLTSWTPGVAAFSCTLPEVHEIAVVVGPCNCVVLHLSLWDRVTV